MKATRGIVVLAPLAGALVTALFVGPAAPSPAPLPPPPPPPVWKVLAWNDLGMHCMDADYSVFSLLPPFNTVNAQAIRPTGMLVGNASGITISYEAVADPEGSRNATSAGKTNFWTYAQALYGGSSTTNTGLAGFNMPGLANSPQSMAFDGAAHVFHAEGIPITPYDDQFRKRPYPMMRIVARDYLGAVLASSDVVLPVSDEMDCSACHSSGSGPAARPAAGWAYASNHGQDYKLNILRLHDERHLSEGLFQLALSTVGYSAAGLVTQVTQAGGSPVLCARCHPSNALPGSGITGVPRLTHVLHEEHAAVLDPVTGLSLDSSSNRSACYRCHPGSETRCLRGAMGRAVGTDGNLAMQCQGCHGSMNVVGAAGRVGWLDEPACQQCHTGTAVTNNGQIRYTTAFEANGAPRVAVNATFATNANVPAAGYSLYRFSTGHGGLRCEACHGSTHAEYPGHGNDDVQALALQGHAGMLVECTACHASSPETISGGPHGLHPIGQDWIDHHGDAAQNVGLASCRSCHGTTLRGTVLSVMKADRVLATPWGAKALWRGSVVGCWGCHLGPTDDDPNPNQRPVASGTTASSSGGAPVNVPLAATDPDGNPLTFRIVSQPAHGRVALNAATATYYPDAGFAGADTFTFAANDTMIDSNLATVSITRGAEWANYGSGIPGSGGVVPAFTLSARPVLGSTVLIQIENTSGFPMQYLLVIGSEPTSLSIGAGGLLLASPDFYFIDTLHPGGLTIPWTVPALPSLVGVTIYGQVIEVDPGAHLGYAFSRGLRVTLGN